MITEQDDQRQNDRAVMAWSLVVSLAINLAILALSLWLSGLNVLLPKEQEPELAVSTSIIRLEKTVPEAHQNFTPPKPQPQEPRQPQQPKQQTQPQPRHEDRQPRAQPTEIARIVDHAPPQPKPAKTAAHQATLAEQLAQQQAMFNREAQQLREERQPLSAATIDPNQRPAASRSYSMNISGLQHANGPGEGYLTPLQRWIDGGQHCYYGRYDWVYPDGSTEEANIPWAFCFPPNADPIARGIHQFPFPLPLPGYRLPPGTELQPIERSVYSSWLSMQ
jgi:outer membrane biosynthesis protein TonB